MEKTTVYLSAAQKSALAQAAQREGRSEATLIRAGIDVVTAQHRVAETSAPYAAGRRPELEEGVPRRPRWITREAFLGEIVLHQADPELRRELRELAPDTTDGEPLG